MLEAAFKEVFDTSPTGGVFSPGRVNLIGEHIDYCGGLVMPMAIEQGTRGVFATNASGKVRIFSRRFSELIECDAHDLMTRRRGHWSDYVSGVLATLGHRELGLGFDLLVDSSIEAGGLSSSASLTTAIAVTCHHVLHGVPLASTDNGQRLALALACQKAENDFVGVSCGIMDQASVMLGGCMSLDCQRLNFTPVVLPSCVVILVMDTGVPRRLAASAYNQRVKEVEEILARLKPLGVDALAQVEPVQLEEALALVADTVLCQRLTHVVTENERVRAAADALAREDVEQLGQLMLLSHTSLANDYEVSCLELDLLTGLAMNVEGCHGARMTGAGFGGCAIALVDRDAVDHVMSKVAADYEQKTGINPTMIVSGPGDAAHTWAL